ncbi:hypothetical protein P171DRAFT_476354, partial [Karstenula rhodostoma CBS 690.94]
MFWFLPRARTAMALPADPSVPLPNGRCMLLELPAELRLEIWKLALTPAPRALTYRTILDEEYRVVRSGLSSMRLDDVSQRPTYTSPLEAYKDPLKVFTKPSQVRYLCKQIFSESKDIPLNLNSFTFSSSSRPTVGFAMKHFEQLIQSPPARNMWSSIRVVTIRCEKLRGLVEKTTSDDPDSQLSKPKEIFENRHIPFYTRKFLRQNPQTTLRICVPELGTEQS